MGRELALEMMRGTADCGQGESAWNPPADGGTLHPMIDNPGIKIARVMGIPVYLHWTWFLLLALFVSNLTHSAREVTDLGNGMSLAVGLVAALLGFASLLAHEFGHAIAARFYGIPTERIVLFMLGGMAQIADEPRKPSAELVVAIAGPAVSFALMLVFLLGWVGAGYLGAGPGITFICQILFTLNMIFGVFNMIPGFPMDGGRVLRALIWGATGSYTKATRIASAIGQGIGFGFVALGAFFLFQGSFQGILTIALGLYLNYLAKMSRRQSQFRAAFDSLSVGQMMRPVQVVVPSRLPVRRVVDDYIYRIHEERFPVVDGGTLLGYISADEVGQLDRDKWDSTEAGRLARPYLSSEMLAPALDAQSAFRKVTASGRPNLPVFQGRQLVGHVFLQDILHHLKRFGA